MGGSSGKVRKLNPKTLKELQDCVDVDFTKQEIEAWFLEYKSSLRKGLDELTVTEFQDVYNSVFDGDANEFTKHLFRTFDSNGDGYVDFKEFIVGLCVSGSDDADTRLRWAFKMYDCDGNGYITRGEMAAMIKSILLLEDDTKKAIYKMIADDTVKAQNDTEDDKNNIEDLIKDFFKKADKNNDNKISIEEFVNGVNTMPVILNLLQCAPEGYNPGEEEIVQKFDELEVKQARESTKDSSVSEHRSQAYVSKSTKQ